VSTSSCALMGADWEIWKGNPTGRSGEGSRPARGKAEGISS